MTEEQIENRVCAMFDELDALFLQTFTMSTEEYDRRTKAINHWADEQYRKRYPQWH